MDDDDELDLFGADEGVPPRRGMDAHRQDEESITEGAGAASSGRRRRAPMIFLCAVLAIILLVVGVLGYFLKHLTNGLDDINREPLTMPTASPRPSTATDGARTFVLLGSDSRGWDRGRSDSLMVAYLPADREHLYLISFLRDMWVTIPPNKVIGKPSQAKINAAYSWGGVPLTIQTLENLTNVRMDHAAVIDFTGFKELTTALGGVQVYNDQDSTIEGMHFPAGDITLKGNAALKYVRERRDLKNGDLDRARRQRDVLTAIIDKTLSAGTLANPSKFDDVATLAGRTMTVDDKLTNAEIRKLAMSLRFTSGDSVVQVQAPISGFGRSKDGQAYDLVDKEGLQELSDAMRNDTMDVYVENHPQ